MATPPEIGGYIQRNSLTDAELELEKIDKYIEQITRNNRQLPAEVLVTLINTALASKRALQHITAAREIADKASRTRKEQK